MAMRRSQSCGLDTPVVVQISLVLISSLSRTNCVLFLIWLGFQLVIADEGGYFLVNEEVENDEAVNKASSFCWQGHGGFGYGNDAPLGGCCWAC